MRFQIDMTASAEAQLHSLPVREQRIIFDAVMARLERTPTTQTRAVKQLRPNTFAEFELRVGDWRVLYNVEAAAVLVVAIGRKDGNKLFVDGVEFHDHQDDSSEPTVDESGSDAE